MSTEHLQWACPHCPLIFPPLQEYSETQQEDTDRDFENPQEQEGMQKMTDQEEEHINKCNEQITEENTRQDEEKITKTNTKNPKVCKSNMEELKRETTTTPTEERTEQYTQETKGMIIDEQEHVNLSGQFDVDNMQDDEPMYQQVSSQLNAEETQPIQLNVTEITNRRNSDVGIKIAGPARKILKEVRKHPYTRLAKFKKRTSTIVAALRHKGNLYTFAEKKQTKVKAIDNSSDSSSSYTSDDEDITYTESSTQELTVQFNQDEQSISSLEKLFTTQSHKD
jgi:hypothetical protein